MAVNEASSLARDLIGTDERLRLSYASPAFVLSVGATPTANAARVDSEHGERRVTVGNRADELELHAGK